MTDPRQRPAKAAMYRYGPGRPCASMDTCQTNSTAANSTSPIVRGAASGTPRKTSSAPIVPQKQLHATQRSSVQSVCTAASATLHRHEDDHQ